MYRIIKGLAIGFLIGVITTLFMAFRECVGRLSKEKLKKLVYVFWRK